MGFLMASPLSDRSKELKAPASQTKSCITWAPTERSWRQRYGALRILSLSREAPPPAPFPIIWTCSQLTTRTGCPPHMR